MTANLQSRARHPTCAACGGPRVGHAWKSELPVCDACKGKRTKRARCPRRCGPDGLFGPACRFGEGHAAPCEPVSAGRQLRILAHLQQLGRLDREATHA